jgi:hypothetical protein
VTATSASNAWAVGSADSKTLIIHWNGSTWKQVPSPSPEASTGLADFLNGVAITASGSAWAVGDISCGCGPGLSLVERWNGKVWTQVPSPTPGGGTVMFGVVAMSARSVWAVGATGSGDGPTKTLVLRWNGTGWQRVSSPSPRASAELSDVAATSADNAWAVGSTSNSHHGSFQTLILRWNGTAWG